MGCLIVFPFNLLDVACRLLWLSVRVEKVLRYTSLVLPCTCVHVYWMQTFSAAKQYWWTLHRCKLHGSQWSKQYVMACTCTHIIMYYTYGGLCVTNRYEGYEKKRKKKSFLTKLSTKRNTLVCSCLFQRQFCCNIFPNCIKV